MTLGTYVPKTPANPETVISRWYGALAAVKAAGNSLSSGDVSAGAKQAQDLATILDDPTVAATTTTTTSDAGVALNLTTELGAAFFQSDSYYRINARVCARGNGAEYFYAEVLASVLGGTTPVLLGSTVVVTQDNGFNPGTDPAVAISTNDVVLNITGVASNPANWRVECRVSRLPIAASAS